MSVAELALLAVAAFGAGVLNAVAGGGSFLTLPALIQVGIPPIVANATSALAVSPGYLGGTLAQRRQWRDLPRADLWRDTFIAAVGGVLGAGVLLLTPERLFSALVPWLLLFASLLFALAPRLTGVMPVGTRPRWRTPALLAVAAYGGYFNGGLGILLMALFNAAGERRLAVVNVLKNWHSLVLSAVSVATFAGAGVIAWGPALLMMLASVAGGYAGAHGASRLPEPLMRALVVGIGLAVSLAFFLR